jgi:hypothetical protein
MKTASEIRRDLYALSLATGLLAGCGQSAPRRLDLPTFDPGALFAEPGRAAAEPTAAKAASSFEAALHPAAPESPAAAASPGGAVRIPLGSGLVAELPAGAAPWPWGVDDRVTLAIEPGDGARPQALLYAEAWSPEERDDPAADWRRFLSAVVPSAVPSLGSWRALGGRLDPLLAKSGMSRTERGELSVLLAIRTLGRGLGFEPSSKFSGWRWLGRNARGSILRMARFEGSWGEPRPLDPRLEKVLRGAGLAATVPPGGPRPREPAMLLIGQASSPSGDVGVHLALLCVARPQCGQARQLAHLLSSIEAGSGTYAALRESPPRLLEELAAQAHLPLAKPAVAGPPTP